MTNHPTPDVSFLPGIYDLADIHGMDAGREVGVHLLGNFALEILRVEGCSIHDLALDDHLRLCIIGCSIGGVGSVKAQSGSLVLIASAFPTHVCEHLAMLHIEGHHSEVFGLIHEFLGITFLRHIDGQGCASPESSDAAPPYGHGIALHLIASSEQLGIVKPLKTILRKVFPYVKFRKSILFLCGYIDGKSHHEAQQECCNNVLLHVIVFVIRYKNTKKRSKEAKREMNVCLFDHYLMKNK